MKSRIVLPGTALLAALAVVALAVPAASTITITLGNSGTVSGDTGTGSVVSTAEGLKIASLQVSSGPAGEVTFAAGPVTSNIRGGRFQFTSGGTVLFATRFDGTWTKLKDGRYQLEGKFSGVQNGVRFTGVTTQLFGSKDDDHSRGEDVLVGLHGATTITATPS